MKKKVLYLITKSTWGGAQRYVFDLATNIDRKRYEPVIALGGKDELYDRLREAGLKVISIKGLERNVSVLKDLQASFHIASILWKEQPDVLHVNSSKVGVLGTVLGRLFFIPRVIFTSHGWAFNEDRPSWQKIILKWLHWFTVFFSHQTIVVSNGLKRQMNWPLVQKKMKIVHLGRETGLLKSKADARELLAMRVRNTATSLYAHVSDTWLGTIAELHPTKCLHIAIEAVALLVTDFPTLRYVIIHDGEERERLERLVHARNLTDHVFFTGTIPDAAALLTAFDIFLLPSRSEALGYVLIEAGQAGVPVIASRVGGIPDIVTHEENGLLVEPLRADELAAAIRTLLEDEQKRAQLAAAHTEKSNQFTLTKMVTETEAIYKNH